MNWKLSVFEFLVKWMTRLLLTDFIYIYIYVSPQTLFFSLISTITKYRMQLQTVNVGVTLAIKWQGPSSLMFQYQILYQNLFLSKTHDKTCRSFFPFWLSTHALMWPGILTACVFLVLIHCKMPGLWECLSVASQKTQSKASLSLLLCRREMRFLASELVKFCIASHS